MVKFLRGSGGGIMKLSCTQENFNRGLNIVSRASPNRTSLPITHNVLLACDGGQLKLTATNLELAVSTWIGAQIDEEGDLTIPSRLLSDFIGSLPNDVVHLVGTEKPTTLLIDCGRFQARLIGTPASEFPPVPTVEEGIVAKVDPKILRSAISKVVFAAATEDSRPVLTGVKIEMMDDNLTLATADGFRLAVHHCKLTSPVASPVDVVVPSRTMNEIARLLSDQDDEIEIIASPDRGKIMFRLKGVEVVSQLVQGAFPNYGQLIPQNYATRVEISVQEFIRAVRSAAIFARDGSGIVRIHVQPGDPGVVQVMARVEEVGENTAELNGIVDGGEAKVAFNAKYLQDVLNAIDTQFVALEVTTPSSPGVLKSSTHDNYIHVVMPMFVQW
jgi:DNA polymerase-3 subunit beta